MSPCCYQHVPLLLLLIFLMAVSCSDTTEPQIEEESYSHTRNPGSSAADILNGDQFSQIVVEIDYMPGVRPTAGAVTSLGQFLETHTDKNNVVMLPPDEIPAGGQVEYSANEIRELEETHRDRWANGHTLALYCLFVDGGYSESNVLGIAYYNTSCTIFGQTVADISGGATQPSREKIESTVLRHELGHLFGLVNNGLAMQEDHHDSANGAHCTNESCLMYYAVETTDFFANLFDDTIPEFGTDCLADIHTAAE